MDQFFARILKIGSYIRFEDDSRYATIASSQRENVRTPDPRDRGYTGTMATPSFIIELLILYQINPNEIFTFSGAVEALTSGCLSTEYIEW